MSATFLAPKVVEGEGFRVRWYREGDGPELRAATNSSYAHLRGFLGWATDCQTDDVAAALVRKFHAQCLLGNEFVLAIVADDDRTILGGTGFHLRGAPVGQGSAEIGMWIRGEQAGRGLGTAVLRAMTGWGFTDWPWARLGWHCDTRNAASRKVAERSGYALEGVLRGVYDDVHAGRRDMAVYARLRSEYSA